VVQVKTDEKEGYTALQIGGGTKKAKQLTKPLLGHFIAQGANLKRKLHEFRVSPDAVLPVSDLANAYPPLLEPEAEAARVSSLSSRGSACE
jgi:ribosomal protein L3